MSLRPRTVFSGHSTVAKSRARVRIDLCRRVRVVIEHCEPSALALLSVASIASMGEECRVSLAKKLHAHSRDFYTVYPYETGSYQSLARSSQVQQWLTRSSSVRPSVMQTPRAMPRASANPVSGGGGLHIRRQRSSSSSFVRRVSRPSASFKKKKKLPQTARALFEVFPSGAPNGAGLDPSEWTLFASAAVETLKDVGAFAASIVGGTAAVEAQRENRLRAEEQTRREFGFVDVVTGDGGDEGGVGGKDGGGGGGSRGWGDESAGSSGDGGGDDGDGWMWVRGGSNGFKWLGLFLVCAWWCYFITNDPYMGTLWLACAIACGWGVFLIAGVVFAVGFVANFMLQQYLANTLETDMEGGDGSGIIDKMLVNQQEAQMIKSGRYAKLIPEIIDEGENRNPHLNPRLPVDVNVVGTDTQIAQIKLKPGEEVAASPGAMCYMSSNVMSLTSLGAGGLRGAIMRALAGEPFFINTFRNLGQSDGYIAVGGLEAGDKIAVVELKDDTKHDILCARDSYMCSKGNIRITAAAALRTSENDFKSFSDMLKYRIGFAARLVLSKGNSIFNGEWLIGHGTVCITGKGTVVRRTLKADEEMVVDARAVMALERSVGYDLEIQSSPLAAIFGGAGLFFVRLHGPGTFWLQSLPAQKQLDSGMRLGGRKLKVKTQ
jgi:uncharacterized protein (AIM24 family)